MQNFNSFLLLARNRRVSETITDQAWAVKYMLCRQSQAVSTVSGMCLLWSQRILSKVGHRAVTECRISYFQNTLSDEYETHCLNHVPVI